MFESFDENVAVFRMLWENVEDIDKPWFGNITGCRTDAFSVQSD